MKKFKNIYVEITRRCNLCCPFCPSIKANENSYLSYLEFTKIIDDIKDYTEGIYLHVLGEPLLHPDVFLMIEYASKYLKVNMTTNGKFLKKYEDLLINSNLKILNISIQSQIKDLENVDNYLNDVKSLITRKKDCLAVHLRLWNDFKVSEDLNNKVYEYVNKHKLLKYKNVNLSIQDEFRWPSLDDEVNDLQTSCLGGKSQLGILHNGDVVMCCLDYDGHTTIGNVFKERFSNILQKEDYIKALNNFKLGIPTFSLCKRCTFRNRFKK